MRAFGAAAVAVPLFAGVAAAQTAPIKFGHLSSMTGPAAPLGAAALTGTKLAISELNAAGGLLGRKIDLVQGDDQSNPTAAVSETRRLVLEEKIDAMVGPSISQMVLAGLPIMTEAKVPQISTGGSTQITAQGGPYHFSMIYNAEEAAIALVDMAVSVAGSQAPAILVDNGAQSKSAALAMEKHIAERNLKFAGEQQYEYNTADMTPQLLSLRRAGADALLFFTVSPGDTSKLLSQRLDISWPVKIMGNLSLPTFAPAVLKTAGASVFENVYGQIYVGLSYCKGDAIGQSAYSNFLDRLKAFAPQDYDRIAHLGAVYAYDSAMLLAAAIKATGSTEGPKVAAWIEENAANYHATTATLTASRTSHFLFSQASLVLAEQLNDARADGLFKRVGC
jgi:ABC-type branched-subunit amino acid transport system substrate-binding protein